MLKKLTGDQLSIPHVGDQRDKSLVEKQYVELVSTGTR